MVSHIQLTETFSDWLQSLRDRRAQAIVGGRIDRLSVGLRGDTKSVGDGVSELRIDYGPGYRVYFTERHGALVILLCGGDKSSQQRDIKRAKALASEI